MEPYHCEICDVWIDDGAPHPEVYRCDYCGEFYSEHTAERHWVCQMIEDKEASGL